MPFIVGAQLVPLLVLLKIPERVEMYSVEAVTGFCSRSYTYPPLGPWPDHTPTPPHAAALSSNDPAAAANTDLFTWISPSRQGPRLPLNTKSGVKSGCIPRGLRKAIESN